MTSDTQPLLEGTDLHKSYRLGGEEIEVLKGASITLSAGESVAVVGASGAGKSTLLHVLGGLDRPDQGEVRVSEGDLYRSNWRKRSMLRSACLGFVFQSYNLLPELDVVQNVFLPAMTAHARRHLKHPQQRARDLLEAVGMAHRLEHRPMELSGGEQQRVALARALLNAPKLILADEPTGNLDRDTAGQVVDLLFNLSVEQGRSLMIVTHDQSLAARCDRTLRLDAGVLSDA